MNSIKVLGIAMLFYFSSIPKTYSQIPTIGLIAHYKLNNNGVDESVNGNNGILYNVNPASDRFGNKDSAYYFNGQNSYIYVPNSSSLNPKNGITVSAWIKPENYFGTGSDPIVDKPFISHSSPYYQYHLSIAGDYGGNPHSFGFNVSINNQYLGVNSKQVKWIANNWYFILGSYDGNKIRIYVNGIPADSLTIPGVLDVFPSNLYIGKFGNRNDFTPGTIDDVRIYNRALTNEEINNLYNETQQPTINLSFNSVGTCSNLPVKFNPSGLVTYDSLKWNFGDNSIQKFSSEASPVHSYSTTGEYVVKLDMFLKNNTYTFSEKIQITGPPDVHLGNDTTLCTGTSLLADAGNSGTSYLWNNGSTQNKILVNNPGQYIVTVSNLCGDSKDTLNVLYSSIPTVKVPSDTAVCRNSLLKLHINGPDTYTYNWGGNKVGKDFESFITDKTSLNLSVSDPIGCKNLYTINLGINECVNEIEIPNVFTPNGDGTNDFWVIKNLDQYPNASISVVNRWGSVVYSSLGYKYPWDGLFNGKKVSPGCYYYIITLNNGHESYTGPVMIYW